MRPNTLCEAAERMRAGTPRAIAIGEFLDAFYTASVDTRAAMLDPEPPHLDSAKENALMAAIAEHLAKSWLDRGAPRWAEAPSRFLDRPWFTAKAHDPGLCEYLTFSSPAAFKRRNIMTDGAPLRRATTPPSRFGDKSP